MEALLVMCASIIVATTEAGAEPESPRFSFDTTSAAWGDLVTVRADRVRLPARLTFRLYLVPRSAASSVRSRFDARLSYIGSVASSRRERGRLRFSVPPLADGRYVLAYWCPGCGRAQAFGVQRSASLRVAASAGSGACPVTIPNGDLPAGVRTQGDGWKYHGNGALWALLPPNGVVVTNALGAYKMPWVAAQEMSPAARFTVRYQILGQASAAAMAPTVPGTLSGYDGPSWASRMSFEPGCWQITGRLLDVSLTFVVQVSRGTG
jgi:hypothetical protein